MKVNIASENPTKIKAVKDALKNYDMFKDAEIVGMKTDSEVNNQPISLDETVQGAINRARNAFKDGQYSFGLESGLIEVSETKSGYVNFCVCVIFDGKDCHIGISSGFEFPKKAVKLILEQGLEMREAVNKIGLSNNPNIGEEQGSIGILTKGRLNRKNYMKQAVITALIHLENPEFY